MADLRGGDGGLLAGRSVEPPRDPFKKTIVPVGIEFLGRPWAENVLIEIGYGYEQATKHRRPPAATPPLEASSR